MRRQTSILLLIATLIVVGSLLVTGGYALHLRGPAYRHEVVTDLETFFRLPCDVAEIRGDTFSSRAFNDVAIWLPKRRDQVFFCRQAILHEPGKNQRNWLQLSEGRLTLGGPNWQLDDFQQIYKSQLDYELTPLELQRIDLENFTLTFARGGLSMICDRAHGRVELLPDEQGVAHLYADRLNGQAIDQGVRIEARFTTAQGLAINHIQLSLPAVPVSSLGLDALLADPQSAGSFAGSVEYRGPTEDGESQVLLSGQLLDVALQAVAPNLIGEPIGGRISIQVNRATLRQRMITHLRGRGTIDDLQLEPIARWLGWQGIKGTASVNLDAIDLALGHIPRLRLEGRAEGVPLDQLLGRWGKGSADGRVNVRIYNLDILNDAIQSADIGITVHPPAGRPGIIERKLLMEVAQSLFQFTWPDFLPESMLPENLEYTQLGVRLLVRDNQLRILGTHGEGEQTILTLKVFGREFGVVSEQAGTYELTPYIQQILEKLRQYDPSRMQEWIQRKSDSVNFE